MIEQKILAVKIKAKGVVEYLRRPQVRQYENNATVIWAWFEEVGLAESITAKLHYELPDGETLTPEQLFTAYTTTEDLINDIPNTKGYGDVVIPSGTKIYTYPIPQGMTTIDGELKYNIVAYLSDDSIFVSQQDKITINKSTPPTGTFAPDVIDSTLEALLASKTDLTDFNALRDGSLGFTLIDLDGHTIDWNATDGTFDMEMLNGAVLQVGQEFYIYGKATELINEGAVVQFAGAQGGHILLKNAVASEINANPQYLLGIATTAFSGNGIFGYVTILGKVRSLDTSAYAEGTVLWFDSTNGGLTNVAPTAPKAKIRVCAVLYQHATQGSIMVRPTFAIKLSSLQDVYVNGEADGNVFVYDSANGYWKGSTRLTALEEQVTFLSEVPEDHEARISAIEGEYIANEAVAPTVDLLVTRSGNMEFIATGSIDINATNSLSLYGSTIEVYSPLNIYDDMVSFGNLDMTGWLKSLGGMLSPDETKGVLVNNSGVYITGNTTVSGDLFVQGTGYETELETLLIKDNQLVLRDGALTGLGISEYAGFRFKLYDGTNDGLLVVGNDGFARVGDEGSLQVIATRQDSPTANGVAYWNNTDKRFDTNSTVLINPAAIGSVPLTINALSGQTARLQQWQINSSTMAYLGANGNLNLPALNNNNDSANARIILSDTGTQITRDKADSNPALKVNLANASATGNIAEFQKAGTTLARISNGGYFGSAGIQNNADYDNSSVNTTANGVTIVRNKNDANPALTVNEQQGTGDILRLQFGGATKSVFNKDGWLGMVGITTPLYSIHTGGNIAIQNTEPEFHLIDTNNDSDYYIANSNGTFQVYDSTNDTVRLSISSAGKTTISDLQVNTDGTLLATNNANGAYTVSALSNYKFVEVRATLDGYRWCSSGKIPVGKFVYDSVTPANSTGLSMIVTGKPSGVYGTPATFTLYPANSGLTSLTVDADMSNYDITFEIIGWTY